MFRQAVFNRASWTCALFVRRLASTPVLPIAAAVPSVDSDLAIADEAIPITAYFSHAFEAQHCQNCWPSRIRTEDHVIHSHRVLPSRSDATHFLFVCQAMYFASQPRR